MDVFVGGNCKCPVRCVTANKLILISYKIINIFEKICTYVLFGRWRPKHGFPFVSIQFIGQLFNGVRCGHILNHYSVQYECLIILCTQQHRHTNNNNKQTTSECIRMIQWWCLTIETRHYCQTHVPPARRFFFLFKKCSGLAGRTKDIFILHFLNSTSSYNSMLFFAHR